MKRRINNCLGKIFSRDPKSLDLDFGSYEYVSFDIFDTLVKRTVEKPIDVFRLTAREASLESEIDFVRDRVKAEADSRKTKDQEITLDDIYKQLLKNDNYSMEDCEKLKNLEEQIEIRCCIPRPEIKELFDKAFTSARILIVSDMYLRKGVVLEILYNSGYRIDEHLFLSSDIGLTKRDGSMFSYIKKELEVESPEKLLHIGDNFISDFFRPRQAGLNAALIKK